MKIATPILILLLLLSACGLECLDKKTGMHKSSATMEYSQANGLFQFELLPATKTIILDSGRAFRIKKAWVENSWKMDCVNNRAVIIKEPYFQTVIDGDFKYDTPDYDYSIQLKGDSSACVMGGVLSFSYKNSDSTLIFIISKNKILEFNQREKLTELKFYKSSN